MIELTPITDPNQLTLGIESQVLTTEQTQKLEGAKKRILDSDQRLRETLLRKRAQLVNNGFEEGQDFKFSLEEVDREDTINLARWNEPAVEVTFNIKRVKGECVLLVDHYEAVADVIVKNVAGFDIINGKVECYRVNGNMRKVTFRTLKEKLAERNAEVQWQMMTTRNHRSVTAYTVEKYAKLAPTAQVLTSRDCTGHGARWFSFDVVEVKFPNGNLLVVKPGVHQDQERVHKFIDVTTANKSAEELAQYLGQ
jgi:hypothetical protein